eukprot:393694-Pleurochrysis_carterae.AAC.1
MRARKRGGASAMLRTKRRRLEEELHQMVGRIDGWMDGSCKSEEERQRGEGEGRATRQDVSRRRLAGGFAVPCAAVRSR